MKELVIKAQQGDSVALEEIYYRIKPFIISLIIKLGKAQYKDDLLQECYLILYKNINKYDPNYYRFLTYFGTAFKNKINSYNPTNHQEYFDIFECNRTEDIEDVLVNKALISHIKKYLNSREIAIIGYEGKKDYYIEELKMTKSAYNKCKKKIIKKLEGVLGVSKIDLGNREQKLF